MKKYIIIILVLLLTGCSKVEYKEKITINIKDNIPLSTDYVRKYKNISDIKWDNLIIEDNTTYHSGLYSGVITVNKKDINIKLEVIDDEKPVISGVHDIEIIEGTDVDLLEDVNITDNSKDELKKEVIGDYDINKVGTYNLTVSATDKSGNNSSEKFNLIVKEKSIVKPLSIENVDTEVETDLSGVTSKGYEIKKIDGVYYIKGIIVANKTYALSSSYNPNGLTKEFTTAFNKMKEAAKIDGVTLTIISGFRSYNYQKALYNGYVKNYGKASADTFSARAGHSEHQTGLAADLNQIDDNFGNTKAGIWLNENSYKYGFILRYPKGKQSITGYKYEPWHFRYIGDEAENLYVDGNWITLEEYLGIDSKYAN